MANGDVRLSGWVQLVGVPPLIHAVTAWIAGLLVSQWVATDATTVSRAAPTVLGIALATILAGVLAEKRGSALGHISRLGRAPLIVCLAVSALWYGEAEREKHAACLSKLADSTTALDVALDVRAEPRAFVRGEARGTGPLAACRVPASIKVSDGSAPPGNIARFVGKRVVTGSTLALDGAVKPGTGRDPLRAWRGNTGENLDRLFGPRAPLARALLIADQQGIAPDIRDRFADAGLVHMLSISGLHVALIASGLTVLASALRLPRSACALASLLVVAVYVLALGAPPPAVRSAVMLATVVVAERWQRPVHPWTALALGAAIPTVQPDVVVDLGWQLSVAGMASLVAARAIFRRLRRNEPPTVRPAEPAYVRGWTSLHRAVARVLQRLDGWRWTLARELATGVIATVVTAPLVAWHFGRVSLIAPLSNLAANPVVTVLQPALFIAMVLAPWPRVASLAADACRVPLAMLDSIASISARAPMAALHIAPGLAGALLAGIASAACIRATATRRSMPAILVAAIALAAAIWSPYAIRGSGRLELHMIDVGQGDAIAIRTPRGNWILVDAGRSWRGGDAGRRVVVPYLRHYGGKVIAFVLSHPHDDHAGGAASVINALEPRAWWEPAYVGTSDTYRDALRSVESHHIVWHRAHPSDSLVVDGVVLRMLAPDSLWTASQTDPNLASVVVRVEFGDVRWLLTGDAEAEEEAWLVHEWGDGLAASVLKVGHHGSRTSSSAPFLDAVNPAVALVSVGADNRYGHPSPAVMSEFSRRGIRVLRTDRDGTIVARTDGHVVEIETRAGHWVMPPRQVDSR